jgi:hypothetical protein
MAGELASGGADWTAVGLAAAAVAIVGASIVTAWIRVIERAQKLRRNPRGDRDASSAADSSWQITILVLFGVSVVLAGLTVVGSTQSGSSSGQFSSAVIFTDLAGAGALLSGVAAVLAYIAGYRHKQRQSDQQAAANQEVRFWLRFRDGLGVVG